MTRSHEISYDSSFRVPCKLRLRLVGHIPKWESLGITRNHSRPFGWSKKCVRLVTFHVIPEWESLRMILFGEWSFHLTCWNEHSHSGIKNDNGCHEPNNVATGSSASNHALRSTMTLSRKLESGKRKDSRRSTTTSWNCYVK